MDKFYKWMEKKEYGGLNKEKQMLVIGNSHFAEKIELIGYLMEYMDYLYTGWQYLKINDTYWDSANDTKKRFDWLIKTIKYLKG